MSTISTWHGLSLEEERRFIDDWETRGLDVRWARALVWNGILTVDDLRNASDHELATMPAITQSGLLKMCELVGRKPPGNVKTLEEA
jgi:hypothetical protein